MGFAREGNRIAAQKGQEMGLVDSMYVHGHVFRVYDDILGSWLVREGDQTLVGKDSDDVEMVTSPDVVKSELEHIDYERHMEQLESGERTPCFDQDWYDTEPVQ